MVEGKVSEWGRDHFRSTIVAGLDDGALVVALPRGGAEVDELDLWVVHLQRHVCLVLV